MKRRVDGRRDRVKYGVTVLWLSLLAYLFIGAGGILAVDPFYATENGLSITSFETLMIASFIFLGIFAVAAGGDAGTFVAQSLAERHADALLALHLTDVGYPDQMTDFSTLTGPETAFADYTQQWWMNEGTFNMIQSTKLQSLAYGLADSPAGLVAWIMSFMASGTTGKEVEKRLSRDELLTNITIYWVTQTIAPSIRRYYLDACAAPAPWRRTPVPAAVARPPRDAPVPREWAERRVNLERFTELPRGGHFVAWEEPELYATDVREFVGEMRSS